MPPETVFQRLGAGQDAAWLDSSLSRPADGRYSIMGCDPAWVFTATSLGWEIRHRTGERRGGTSSALAELERQLEDWRVEPSLEAGHLPFQTGAMGWLSYDLGRRFESVPAVTVNDLDMPDVRLGWYDAALVWDHQANALWLVSTHEEARRSILARIRDGAAAAAPSFTPAARLAKSDFTRAEYLQAVEAIRAGIACGEYYQLNLVQRFACEHTEDVASTYLRLRQFNPAPFAAFLHAPEGAVLCSSPERFLHVTAEGAVQTRPIKGTRPRASDPADDGRNCAELIASDKERAELLMIVDLLRNDLGRVCIPGSVHVPALHALESFATVHHLVGEVRGRLRPGTSLEQLLRAVFPGGSITGAPKISAMREIERLERHRRGIAMGSIGYFSAHGTIDLNIAIRTAIVRDRCAYVSVGAGIVWDSDPAAEYRETLAKAHALFAALGVRGDAS